MILYYKIEQGELRIGEELVAKGLYSGDYEHKNDPQYIGLKSQGPLPVGVYRIGTPMDTDTHGPYFIPLIPLNLPADMYGRGGFGIHGERIEGLPGHASDGCIICPHDIRLRVGEHVGGLLVVLSGSW